MALYRVHSVIAGQPILITLSTLKSNRVLPSRYYVGEIFPVFFQSPITRSAIGKPLDDVLDQRADPRNRSRLQVLMRQKDSKPKWIDARKIFLPSSLFGT